MLCCFGLLVVGVVCGCCGWLLLCCCGCLFGLRFGVVRCWLVVSWRLCLVVLLIDFVIWLGVERSVVLWFLVGGVCDCECCI